MCQVDKSLKLKKKTLKPKVKNRKSHFRYSTSFIQLYLHLRDYIILVLHEYIENS